MTGHAMLERVRMFGTQSADYITASGHSGRIVTEASLQAKTGRIHDRTRTLRSTVKFLLHRGHRPYMTRHDVSRGSVAVVHNHLVEGERDAMPYADICSGLPASQAAPRA